MTYATRVRGDDAAPDEKPTKIPPALSCSDCKAVLRTTYFVMNERPVCPKCRGEYKAKVDRGTGNAAMVRAIGYGLAASLAGAVLFSAFLYVAPAIRIIAGLVGIGIGMLVAKAIGKATANYGGRGYQIVAVTCTYFAISLAAMGPVIRTVYKINHVKVPPKSQSRTGPAGEQAEIRDEMNTVTPRENEDPAVTAQREKEAARADSLQRLEAARAAVRNGSPDGSFASRLNGSVTSVIVAAIGLFVVLPIISSFGYGMYAGVLTIFALIYGMKRAWEMTGLVTDYELSGPFRVGTGPIDPTVGDRL
jgi:hypothetical protein